MTSANNYDQEYLRENPVVLLQLMDAANYENTMHVENSNTIFTVSLPV